jgi:hypothetical protein
MLHDDPNMNTLLDNCVAYLKDLRGEGDPELADMDDGAIQREAMRMCSVLIDVRTAFMAHDFDNSPED